MMLTPAQQAVVEHRGCNLLVTASAGAGKTEVLVRRCLSLIADPQQPCTIDRLLVVTFTRLAAAELRVRLGRMLREAAERAPSAELVRHLRMQERLIDAADIGTIDAWCGRIVREHFAQAGVDPGFSVLSEPDARVLRQAVLDDLLNEVYRGEQPLCERARAWIARAGRTDDSFLRQLIQQLNLFREHLVNPHEWFERQRLAGQSESPERILAGALAEECAFQYRQLSTRLAELPEEAAAALRPYCEQLARWRERLNRPEELMAVVSEVADFSVPAPGPGGESEFASAMVNEVRERWLKGRLQKTWSPDTIASVLEDAPRMVGLVETLLDLEERYQQMLMAAKHERASYEFGDVLRMALDLLGRPAGGQRRQPTPIAEGLQERYEHILVDEYQDTSPVQVEILRLVTRQERGRSNRFMVGDVKQSIYGFRQAEPRLLTELAADLEAGRQEGRVACLSDNFRSHPRLLAALNELFARLFDPALGGTEYGPNQWLGPGRQEREIANPGLDDRPRVEVHVVEQQRTGRSEADEDEVWEVELIEREAQLVADQIHALLKAEVRIPQATSDDRLELRPLRLGDMVVLLRSAAGNAPAVARILRDNGIACLAGGRESMLETVEVREVCNLLRLLVNRRQDVPLAAYLRGPLVGLSEAELLEIRRAPEADSATFYQAVDYYRRAGRPGPLAAKLDSAMRRLEAWSVAGREEELPTLLRRILQEEDYALWARALKGGLQRVAMLRSLQNLAEQFAATGQGGLDEFVAYLDLLAREEVEPASLAAGQENVVRIMTIHAAKGLEFPVVFLLGTGGGFNTGRQNSALQCDERLGLGLRFADYSARRKLLSASHPVIARQVALRELEEELRLLYVAATRARERLIIVGHAPAGRWEEQQELHGEPRSVPPLVSRMTVVSRLEWILMAAAGCPGRHQKPPLLDVVTHRPKDIRVVLPGQSVKGPAESSFVWQAEDEAWVARGRRLLTAEVDLGLAELPAALSVSAIKDIALREQIENHPMTVDRAVLPLATPRFAATAEDGRELGLACHRFLEMADFKRLGSIEEVEAQVSELVAAGRLSSEQAALLPREDLAWLGGSELGMLLGRYADRLRRELPFVYALPLGDTGERTMVRGIMDCVFDTPEGLIVIDFKTDRPGDPRDWELRLAGYRMQLQLYGLAAEAVLARPVRRAVLVFLQARQTEDVLVTRPALAELLAQSVADGNLDSR